EVDVFAGTITLVNNGRNTSWTSGRMIRTNSQSIALVRGNNLGGTVGNTTTNWFALDLSNAGSTQLGGAGGAKGTPYINVVPGFVGDTSQTGSGTDLMTYSFDVGF